MVMTAPLSGVPSRWITLPRSTAARVSTIVPLLTPVWMAFGPVYRNAVDEPIVVTALSATGGAWPAGSGGLGGPGGVVVAVSVGVAVAVTVAVTVPVGVAVGVAVVAVVVA